MSRPQEPPRSFFPFGNPFRMRLPRGTNLSPQLLAILRAFEATLEERLKKLMPKSNDEIFSLSWMTLAMQSLCETHHDIKTLTADLELPVGDWDEKWIDLYLDISVILLDICIAFSSELSRMKQGNLLVQFALHSLEDSASSKQFVRACSPLDGWRQHIGSKNPRIEKCGTILDNLVGSLDFPKVKKSAKGKVLMQAMYGVKMVTVLVCRVFAVAFSRSAKLLDLDVADMYSWSPAFKSLQNLVNEEIRVRFSSGRFPVFKELEAVDSSVKKLYPTVQGVVDTFETESFMKSVEELRKATEKLSQGSDLLAKGVDGFFQVVLTGRDALLSNMRSGGTVYGLSLGGDIDAQVVN